MRYVFDQPYLLDGMSVSIIAPGLFGFPAALDLALMKLGVEQQPSPLTGKLFDGVKDTLREWWLVVRYSFIGVWVGSSRGLPPRLSTGHSAPVTCAGSSLPKALTMPKTA